MFFSPAANATAVQQNIMSDVERKLDEKFSSFLNVMKDMLGRKG